ncbi:MAG: acyltransferase [Tardiphaga sp.]|uniref:acyltransferase family protein n=1 Tax=Tardiphaga sp. TaxID=1926292 RepID=UPI0019ADB5E2|nr:acyltransferase [Tardiphaga sp.]MBC7583082.1 acyltransferase [Tardiphaga sp.]
MRAKQDDAVDGLRGVTLLAIVTTHFVPPDFFAFNIPKPASAVLLVAAGYFVMALLMKHAAALDGPWRLRARTIGGLLVSRHIRIWPVIAIVIALYCVLAFVFPDPVTTQIYDTWPLYLAYLGNIPKILYGAQAFPAQFWLVSAQEQMILCYALGVIAVGLSRANRVLPWLIGFGIAGRFVMTLLFMPHNPALGLETLVSAVDALALGMTARLAVEKAISRNLVRRTNLTAALCLGLLWMTMPNLWSVYFTLVPLIVALLSCALIVTLTDPMRTHRFNSGILIWPPFVVLGQMSLTLFFTHPLIATLLRLVWAQYIDTPLPWWQLAVAGPLLALAFAFVFFRVVEVPIRRLRAGMRAARLPIVDRDADDAQSSAPSPQHSLQWLSTSLGQ